MRYTRTEAARSLAAHIFDCARLLADGASLQLARKDELPNAVIDVLDHDVTRLAYEPTAFPNGAHRRGARNPYVDRDLLLPQVH